MDHRFQESPTYDSWGLGAAKSKEEIEVIIFISKEPLQDGETMDLEIVFTLYTGEVKEKEISRLLTIAAQSDFLLIVFFCGGDSFVRFACCW